MEWLFSFCTWAWCGQWFKWKILAIYTFTCNYDIWYNIFTMVLVEGKILFSTANLRQNKSIAEAIYVNTGYCQFTKWVLLLFPCFLLLVTDISNSYWIAVSCLLLRDTTSFINTMSLIVLPKNSSCLFIVFDSESYYIFIICFCF